MLSTIPTELENANEEFIDKQILRAGMIAELDAVTLYEQMAARAKSSKVKAALLDIAREEKTHFGEFQTLLLKLDEEQVNELEHGKKEIEELSSETGD